LSFRVTRRDDTRTVGYHGDFSSNVPLRKQIGFTLRRECIHPDVRRTRSTARRIGWMQAFHARTPSPAPYARLTRVTLRRGLSDPVRARLCAPGRRLGYFLRNREAPEVPSLLLGRGGLV